jgi:hypothetical protein
VEVVNEPVAKQQAKAKALRLKSNPRPSLSSSAVVGAIENPSSSSGSQVVASEESSSSNPIVNTSSGLSFSSGAGRQFQGVELAIDPEVEVELGEGCVLVSDLLQPPANLRELFEDLQHCAIFDLFKTVIFPNLLQKVDQKGCAQLRNFQTSSRIHAIFGLDSIAERLRSFLPRRPNCWRILHIRVWFTLARHSLERDLSGSTLTP